MQIKIRKKKHRKKKLVIKVNRKKKKKIFPELNCFCCASWLEGTNPINFLGNRDCHISENIITARSSPCDLWEPTEYFYCVKQMRYLHPRFCSTFNFCENCRQYPTGRYLKKLLAEKKPIKIRTRKKSEPITIKKRKKPLSIKTRK